MTTVPAQTGAYSVNSKQSTSRLRFYAGLFCLAFGTLALQLVQTRILSVVLWYHLAFFVISVAMFGLTAGAVWVYLRRENFHDGAFRYDVGYFTAAFALAVALSLVVQMTLLLGLQSSVVALAVWIELMLSMAIPYFFAGVAISLALTRSPYPIGHVYGIDLVGAALGSLGAVALLNATDGPSALLWVAVIAAVGATCFLNGAADAKAKRRWPFAAVLARPAVIALVLALCALANGLVRDGLQPPMVKGELDVRDHNLLFERWNAFSRISAYANGVTRPHMWGPSPLMPDDLEREQRMLFVDSAGATPMYRFSGAPDDAAFLKYDLTNLAYFLPNLRRAAIIGVGGGRDVLSAWSFGLRDVTGVEINPVFVDLLTRRPDFSEFAGVGQLSGLRLVVDEARSWLARSDERFDILQMSLIDTWAATGVGAFTLSENGLYTTEAWRIFLERLTPQGVFTVSRWYAPGDVNETGRMVSLAVATLLEMDVAAPSRHLFVAAASNIATLIVSPSGFTPAQVRILEETAAGYRYRVLLSPTTAPESPVLGAIMGASSRAELEQVTGGLALDLTPPTDDRPFFFNQLPLFDPIQIIKLAAGARTPGVVAGNLSATARLFAILLIALWLVVVTIVVPAQRSLQQVDRTLIVGGTAYFLLIGLGFMLLEIALLQRMSVLLGHPVYALSIVLFSIILATGLGSFLSERLRLDRRSRFIAWALLVALYATALPLWLPQLVLAFEGAPFPIRTALAVAVIVPLGVLLGFGFPSGMRLVSAINPKPTPWFWGINGGAGVLAAIAAVIINIGYGIPVTMIIAGTCYLLLIPAATMIGFRQSPSPASAAAR